jgi:hypothetical protein
MRADSDTNAAAVHTDTNATVHTDMNVNVRAAVRNMPAMPGTVTATVTSTTTLGFRRCGGPGQHYNRCSDGDDAIHPGKGANR